MRAIPPIAFAMLVFATACEDGVFGPLGGIGLQGFDSTFQFVYADFNADSRHPVEHPPPEQQIDVLLYQASLVLTDTSLSSDPMSLWVTVNLRNPTGDSVEVPVAGRTVWPEAYAGPQRGGNTLWVPQGQCTQQPYSRVVGLSDTAQFSFLVYDAMLAGAVPDGRYYWNARFRHRNDTLVLRAGSGDVRLRVPGLSYRVQVRKENRRTVRAQVLLTNLNQAPTRSTFGDCSLSLSLYSDAQRRELVASWHARDLCLLYLAVADVAPGSSLEPNEFAESLQLSRLRDAKLRAGRYYLTAVVSHNWRAYEFPVGTIGIW